MAILNDLKEKSVDVFGATLTRRDFVKVGGALLVGVSIIGADAWRNPVKAASREAVAR